MSSQKRKRSFHEERMADLLYAKIRGTRRSMRDVSRDLGMPANKLSQILSGYLRLDIGTVYETLAVLEIHPNDFFTELNAELAPRKREREPEEALMPEGPITRTALEQLIDERLRVLIEKSVRSSPVRPPRLHEPAEREIDERATAERKTGENVLARMPAKKAVVEEKSVEGKKAPKTRRKT